MDTSDLADELVACNLKVSVTVRGVGMFMRLFEKKL